jgi:hypothetical protein
MKKYCPLTKEIAFARLDKRLSEEDKKSILKARNIIEVHFTLGMWVRNTWIYGNEEERVESLAKDLGEEIFWDADSVSSALLDGYKKHLRQMSKLTKK